MSTFARSGFKRTICMTVVAAALLPSLPAWADTFTGRITGYTSATTPMLFVRLENGPLGGCNTTGRFVMDGNTPKYKATLAAVMAAFHTQTPIKVHYTTTCNTWRYDWDLQFARVGDIQC